MKKENEFSSDKGNSNILIYVRILNTHKKRTFEIILHLFILILLSSMYSYKMTINWKKKLKKKKPNQGRVEGVLVPPTGAFEKHIWI